MVLEIKPTPQPVQRPGKKYGQAESLSKQVNTRTHTYNPSPENQEKPMGKKKKNRLECCKTQVWGLGLVLSSKAVKKD